MKIARSLFVVSFTLASATFAHAQCPTSDDMTIQNAISAAVAAGGGTVQLEARIYDICQPVVLASNVHLRGRGIGATVLQTRPGYPTGPLASFGASIIGSGVANVSVVGLTLDQRTNGRVANGIAFVPVNADFSGAVSHNILIERNQVIEAPIEGGHQYLIWNMRGQNVKIVHNWVDGGFVSASFSSPQEGIESFGGYDVLVEGNTVQAIGGTCLNFGSALGVPDTYTAGLFIRNNSRFCVTLASTSARATSLNRLRMPLFRATSWSMPGRPAFRSSRGRGPVCAMCRSRGIPYAPLASRARPPSPMEFCCPADREPNP